jgi:hypothetical protein
MQKIILIEYYGFISKGYFMLYLFDLFDLLVMTLILNSKIIFQFVNVIMSSGKINALQWGSSLMFFQKMYLFKIIFFLNQLKNYPHISHLN